LFNIILYILYGVLSVFVAVAPIVCIKRKFGGNLKRVRDGVAVYVLFSAILNSVLYTVLSVSLKLQDKIEQSNLSFAVVNALVLTLCALLGRTLWLKAVIKEKQKGDDLLFGAGYASSYIFFGYLITAVANLVICIIYLVNSSATVSQVFASNVEQIQGMGTYTLFLEILQMLIAYVFEAAICVAFYRVLVCGGDKKWLFAATLIHFLGNGVIMFNGLNKSITVLIFFAVTVVAYGIAHFLSSKKE